MADASFVVPREYNYDALSLEAEPRFLNTDRQTAAKMAQIFSGAFFAALVAYLIMSNSTRLSYIHRASLEKRLSVISSICTIVAATSAFLNFFQMTEVDNFLLPGSRNGSVDTARPIEWILTCPLLQLCLVLMGGSRIPESRLCYMPMSSAIVLSLGTLTLFLDTPYTYIVYGVAFCIHLVAMYFNRQQIIERSNGAEGLLSGDSEFRKATLILMITWLPFPFWYMLSPEGVGVFTDNLIIQLGWAACNVTAKFTLIFYLQRIKDNYCNRLKVKREMKGALAGVQGEGEEDSDDEVKEKVSGELSSLVVETMNYLGMAENVERFLRLLQEARITTLEDISELTEAQAEEKQLPQDLVIALQRRQAVWKLEMVDEAEKCLEAAEAHYNPPVSTKKNKHEPVPLSPSESAKSLQDSFNQILPQQVPMSNGLYPQQMNMGSGMYNQQTGTANGTFPPTILPQMQTGPGAFSPNANMDRRMSAGGTAFTQPMMFGNGSDMQQNIMHPGMQAPQQHMGFMRQTSSPLSESQKTEVEIDYDKINQKVDQSMDAKFQKFEEVLSKKFDRFVQAIGDRVSQIESGVTKKVDSSYERLTEKLGSSFHDVRSSMERSQALVEAKIENSSAAQTREHRIHLQENLELQMQRLSASISTPMAESNSNSRDSMEASQRHFEVMREQLEKLQESQKSMLSQIGGTQGMSEAWTEKIIQDSRANSFTLQAKLGAMEEMHKEKQRDFEEKIVTKVQRLVGECTDSIAKIVSDKTQNVSHEVLLSIEETKKSNLNECGKLDVMLNHRFDEMKGEMSSSTENSYGAFTNSIRLQIEGLQGAIASKMDSKLDTLPSRIQHEGQRTADAIQHMLDAKVKDSSALRDMVDSRLRDQNNAIDTKMKENTAMYTSIETKLKDNMVESTESLRRFDLRLSESVKEYAARTDILRESVKHSMQETADSMQTGLSENFKEMRQSSDSLREHMKGTNDTLMENRKEHASMCDKLTQMCDKIKTSQTQGVKEVKDYVADCAQSQHEAVTAVHGRTLECKDRLVALCDHCSVNHAGGRTASTGSIPHRTGADLKPRRGSS